MSPQSIVCATCGAAVPYGRLSCPACGELLASVAGAARSVNGRRDRSGRAAVAERRRARRPRPTSPAAGGHAAAARSPSAPHPAWDAGRSVQSVVQRRPPTGVRSLSPRIGRSTTRRPPARRAMSRYRRRCRPERPTVGLAPPTLVADPTPWPAANAMPPRSGARRSPRPPCRSRSATAAPGAYVPPIVRAEPSGPPAPARAWAGQAAAATAAAKADATANVRPATSSTPRASPNSSAGSPSPVRPWPPSGSCSRGASASSAPRASAISTAGASPARSTRSSC